MKKEVWNTCLERVGNEKGIGFGDAFIIEAIKVLKDAGCHPAVCVLRDYFDLEDEPIKIGDMVRAKPGVYSAYSIGMVQFVEPSGKVWVLRDGSTWPVWYQPDELDRLG